MRLRRWAALILASGLALAACDSGSGAATAGDQEVSFTVQVGGEPEETRVYAQLAEQYEADNPNVTIDVVEIADRDEHVARLSSSFASGEPPEIFLINYRQYAQFVSQGGVEPIGPLIEERDVDLDDYYSEAINAFIYQDELQCFPQNMSSLVVYWNKQVFKDAGVEPPTEGWSWEDFRATAEQLSNGPVDGVAIEPDIIRLAPFVWSNGGEIVDDLASPSRFILDEPEGREALQFFYDLQQAGLMPTEKEVTAQDLETRFTTDKLGMLLESRKVVPGFREVTDLKWDVAPLPVAEEPATILHSDAYCIAAGSDEIEGAADFIAWVNGEDGSTIAALSGRTVPALRSAAESQAFLDPSQPPKNSQVFLDVVPGIRLIPIIPTWLEIEDVAKEIMARLFYEPGYTVDQAIEELDQGTRSLFEEAAG